MNNNKSSLQYTELTPDDIAIHEDLYIQLLLMHREELSDSPYTQIYYEYTIAEVRKANELFQNTFR